MHDFTISTLRNAFLLAITVDNNEVSGCIAFTFLKACTSTYEKILIRALIDTVTISII